MKLVKYILFSLLLAVAMPSEMQAKHVKMSKMYMFGFSASFQDSIIYMTDVQEVAGVWYDTHTKFLLGRQHYSYQLKDYLATNEQKPNRVCVVMFAPTRKEAEKKFIKMRKEYTVKAKGKYDVRYLTTAQFQFQPIDIGNE
jgi:hypothetical protein